MIDMTGAEPNKVCLEEGICYKDEKGAYINYLERECHRRYRERETFVVGFHEEYRLNDNTDDIMSFPTSELICIYEKMIKVNQRIKNIVVERECVPVM